MKFLSAMFRRPVIGILFYLGNIFMFSCSKPVHGRYYANEECFLLEWMEVYPDNTADLKYRGLSEEFNVPCQIEDDTVIMVKERNRTWYWVYRRDTLREGSHIDNPGCRMAKRP